MHVAYNSEHAVKILMIAPEPFFEPRGTPFSEFHRIRALLELGPYGRSRHVSVRPRRRRCRACASSAACGRRSCTRSGSGRRWRRCRSISRCTLTALPARAAPSAYDAVHSHEEGGFIGVVLAGDARRAAPVRHALEPAAAAHQLRVQPIARCSRGAFAWLERFVIRRSRVVIVICPQLEETVRGIDPACRRC